MGLSPSPLTIGITPFILQYPTAPIDGRGYRKVSYAGKGLANSKEYLGIVICNFNLLSRI